MAKDQLPLKTGAVVSCAPQGERSWFDVQLDQPEMTLGIIAHRWQKRTQGDDEYTLDFLNSSEESSKVQNRAYEWLPKVDLSPTKFKKKEKEKKRNKLANVWDTLRWRKITLFSIVLASLPLIEESHMKRDDAASYFNVTCFLQFCVFLLPHLQNTSASSFQYLMYILSTNVHICLHMHNTII